MKKYITNVKINKLKITPQQYPHLSNQSRYPQFQRQQINSSNIDEKNESTFGDYKYNDNIDGKMIKEMKIK